jgi:hypothetical protein
VTDERASVQREVARLASERTALFSRSAGTSGLSLADQSRLRAIERQLDECYTALRRARASSASARNARGDVARRRAVERRHP